MKTQKWEQLFRQIDPAEYSNSGAIISANLPLMLKFLGNGRYMVLLGWLKHNLRAMANHKRNMREVKQILRLHYERNTSIKQISRELAKSKNTVKECPRKFQASNLELTAAWSMDSAELSTLLLPGHSSATSRHAQFLERVCLPPYSNAELGLLRANFKKAQLSQSLSNFSLRTLLPNHK